MPRWVAKGVHRGRLRRYCAALICCVGLAAGPAPLARGASGGASQPVAETSFEVVMGSLENEVARDLRALPSVPAALAREWRSFDRNLSAAGAFVDLGWIALVALVALAGERLAVLGFSRRARHALRDSGDAPRLATLLTLVGCDLAGVAVFIGILTFCRIHLLAATAVSAGLAQLAANVLIRWRVTVLVMRVVLRPGEPAARLVESSEREARRLCRFLSGTALTLIALVGIGRYAAVSGVAEGAGHVIGLFAALGSGALCGWAVMRASPIVEGMIAGRRGNDVVSAIRGALARAWVPVALTVVFGLIVLFAFGLSLGLLDYYYAVTASLGILLVLLVLERLLARASIGGTAPVAAAAAEAAVSRSFRRAMQGLLMLIAIFAFARVWIDALDATPMVAAHARRAVDGAALMLFGAYVLWEIGRLAIERHLQQAPGVTLPGAEVEEASAPAATRLQTMLPFLRAAFGIALGVIAVLAALSSLGVDTAPLIAGAGVFGLAVSFGSQSLVRDIISGLFYMWDDAFRVGEYVDTGRLKGTVETIGLRSVKVRHHNGPLHTIPYGQLGAVTNMSRDFATIKFNLRLDRNCDIETVRKAAKQIGIVMQSEPEIAAEVILPLKMQGIVEVADTALVVRFKFTARPVKPSWVQREYLKRIYAVFAEKGIAFASGALVLQTATGAEVAAAPLPLVPPSRVA